MAQVRQMEREKVSLGKLEIKLKPASPGVKFDYLLPMAQIKSDLFRTALLVVVFLGLFAGIQYWLTRGGWQIVSGVLQEAGV